MVTSLELPSSVSLRLCERLIIRLLHSSENSALFAVLAWKLDASRKP